MATTFIPSEKVTNQIKGIIKLNSEHNAAIRGLLIALFFSYRYTKEEVKYMETEVARIEYENSNSYFGTCLRG